jgi:hypothetical protein
LGGFPGLVRTTLRYVEQQTLTSTSGVTAFYRYTGNDAYDPNYTGGGNQPANYDDFAAHYNRYRVLGSTITVVLLPVSGTVGTATMEVVLYPSNSIDSITTNGAIAQPYALFTMTATTQPVTLVQKQMTKTIVGHDPRVADRLQANYNADPAEIWLWNLCFQTVDATTTASCYAKVVIDYDIEWFDRLSGDIDARLLRLQELKAPKKPRSDRKQIEPDLSDDDEKAWNDLSTAVQSARAEGSTRSGLIVEEKPVKPLLRRTVSMLPSQVSSRHSGMSRDQGDRKN